MNQLFLWVNYTYKEYIEVYFIAPGLKTDKQGKKHLLIHLWLFIILKEIAQNMANEEKDTHSNCSTDPDFEKTLGNFYHICILL